MFTPLNVVMALNKSLQVVHQASFDAAVANSWAKEVAIEIPGEAAEDIRQFLVEDIKLREGLGVEYSDIRTSGMTIAHKPAGGGFHIRDRDFTTASALQIKTDAAAGLGAAAALYGQNALLRLINNPATKAYDGLNFFATGHYVNYKDGTQGTYDNTTTGVDLTTLSTLPKVLAMGAAAIESRVMADGTPRMVRPRWLLHSPAKKYEAWTATAASFISMTDNVMAKKSTYDITPVSVPGLATVGGKDVMILVAELVGGGTLARPFGISTLFPPQMTNFDGLTVPELARMREMEFDCTADLTAFVGHPYLVQRLVSA
ncbi:MAG: uncharacterized protein JWP97_5761 [Labilithrix sp.]|nr:uncharacterized protein [Labilithrix sp.]